MYIENVGFPGPVGVEVGEVIVELAGYGPQAGNIRLMRRGSGTPAVILADRSKAVDAVVASKILIEILGEPNPGPGPEATPEP